MNNREIKILVNNDGEMSFYRMEGGRWCLIDDSDDALRRYISEKASSGIWDDTFFSALRQAAFAQDEDSLMIWFEGTDSAYADFRDCLDECDVNQSIRVKRSRKQQEETWSAEEKPEDEPTEDERNSILAQDVDLSTVPEEPDDPSEPPEEIQAEAVREDTGTLKYPGEHAWSWRKKYPELSDEEKEILRIDQNIIVDSDRVLVNKKIILNANVSIVAKVECIHCVLDIAPNASVDILSDAVLWLKHCGVTSDEEDRCWHAGKERDGLVQAQGELHIYDSLIYNLGIVHTVEHTAALIKSDGKCHIVDTVFDGCLGRCMDLTMCNDFCGSRIKCIHFEGMFIEQLGGWGKKRLEYCTFQILKPFQEFYRSHFNTNPIRKRTVPLLQFKGNIYFCSFTQTCDTRAWENQKSLEIDDAYVQESLFKVGGIISANGVTFDECKFTKCYQVKGRTGYDGLTFKKCTFTNCIAAFDSGLICVQESEPSYTITVEECEFYRCVVGRMLYFNFTNEMKKYRNCLIKSNVFRECIAKKELIYGEFTNNMKDIINSKVEDSKFYSCVCTKYVQSKGTYGLFKKPCEPFYVIGGERIDALSPWTQAMKSAKTEDEAIKIQEKLDETETHR